MIVMVVRQSVELAVTGVRRKSEIRWTKSKLALSSSATSLRSLYPLRSASKAHNWCALRFWSASGKVSLAVSTSLA